MDSKRKELAMKLRSLVIFRNLLQDNVVRSLLNLLQAEATNIASAIDHYAEFVSNLYHSNSNFTLYLCRIAMEDENFYIKDMAAGKAIDTFVNDCVERELQILQEVSQLLPKDFSDLLGDTSVLPQWRTTEVAFVAEYHQRIAKIAQYGYGKYAKNRMFLVRNGEIVPVVHPDSQRLSDLYGYEAERKAVIQNTLALLSGKPAQNVLLYGDAGTGKSSTVKGIVNEYAHQGLRLIEVTKEQLREIPHIIDSISSNPLKFILFIDDLSFTAGEDCFGALKATLEGSVSACTHNTVIYATSNRRHLVQENFSDRAGDDIHRNDSMQETLSLSARFGLRVNFSKPDKKSYVAIVQALAEQHGIKRDADTLALLAEQFALQGSGRSPRTAKQFIHQLINEQVEKE